MDKNTSLQTTLQSYAYGTKCHANKDAGTRNIGEC